MTTMAPMTQMGRLHPTCDAAIAEASAVMRRARRGDIQVVWMSLPEWDYGDERYYATWSTFDARDWVATVSWLPLANDGAGDVLITRH